MKKQSSQHPKVSLDRVRAIHKKFRQDLAHLEKKYFDIYADFERTLKAQEIRKIKNQLHSKTYVKGTTKT